MQFSRSSLEFRLLTTRYIKELRYRIDLSAITYNVLSHVMLYTGMGTDTDKTYLQQSLSNLDIAHSATKSIIDLGTTKTFHGAMKEHKQILSDKDKTQYLNELTKSNGGKFSSLNDIISAMREINSPKSKPKSTVTSTFIKK